LTVFYVHCFFYEIIFHAFQIEGIIISLGKICLYHAAAYYCYCGHDYSLLYGQDFGFGPGSVEGVIGRTLSDQLVLQPPWHRACSTSWIYNFFFGTGKNMLCNIWICLDGKFIPYST
jgi:hypothetical protein